MLAYSNNRCYQSWMATHGGNSNIYHTIWWIALQPSCRRIMDELKNIIYIEKYKKKMLNTINNKN